MLNTKLKLKVRKVCKCGNVHTHVNLDDYQDTGDALSGYYYECSCQSTLWSPQSALDLGDTLKALVEGMNVKPSREVLISKADKERSMKYSAQSYSSSEWNDLLNSNLFGKN